MNAVARSLAAAALLCSATLLSRAAVAQIPSRNIEILAHHDDFPPPAGGLGYASCWSYVHSDGREYAVIGCTDGTAIYNVTDPSNSYLVGFIPGASTLWREMKSYRNWIYVVCERPADQDPGLQIIRMTDPEHPVLAGTYMVDFQTSHTISVDTTRALLFCNGTRWWPTSFSSSARGMRILSIADPEHPVEVGWWPGGAEPTPIEAYIHDSVPVGDRLYAASIYVGHVRVLDVSNPAAPVEIASWTYPGGQLTHNVWPDDSELYLYVTDEVDGQTMRVFDIANLASPELVYEYTPNPIAIVHNVHVRGDELYVAGYTEGIRVLDISQAAYPAEFAWADTYAGTSGGFSGVWGVAPYFPSGIAIASDMNTGLYVFRVVRNFGRVRVEVGDGITRFADVDVFLDGTDSTTTKAPGVARFAPDPGSHTITARRFGYLPATAIVDVTVGSNQTVALTLTEKPTGPYSGTITDASTTLPIADGEVVLAYSPLHAHTDATGAYSLLAVPEDDYLVEVRAPGHVPIGVVRHLGPGTPDEDFALEPVAFWDAMEAQGGWTIGAADDTATQGAWLWGEPFGTLVPEFTEPHDHVAAGRVAARAGRGWLDHEGHEEGGAVPPGPVQPDHDRTPDPGQACFFTGQGTDSLEINQADVDNGPTTLISPDFDLTTYDDPVMDYWRWFYSDVGAPSDWLAVSISNDGGATWTPVDTTRRVHGHWVERTIRVEDHVTPSAQVRLKFVVADNGQPSTVEAAIDDLTIYDGVPTTPVLLAFFDAVPVEHGIELRWRFADASDFSSVALERSREGGPWQGVDVARHEEADGTMLVIDDDVASGATYRYRLVARTAQGDVQTFGPWDVVAGEPIASLAFGRVGPVPSAGAIEVEFLLPRAGRVRVAVVDVAGREVARLADRSYPRGRHTVAWAGPAVPAGVYFVTLEAAGERRVRRVVRTR